MAHTPGPWRWEVNRKMKQLHLSGGKPLYDQYVLGFERWGTGNAQPTFNVGNRMTKAQELTEGVKGREHHEDWFRSLSHPDAKLIAAAPDLLEALQSLANVDESIPYPVWEKVKAAIKKATE